VLTRRRAMLSCIVGLVLIGAVVLLGVWRWNRPTPQVRTYLRVEAEQPHIGFGPAQQIAFGDQHHDGDGFRASIRAMIKSPIVLAEVVASPEMGGLLAAEEDPVTFLQENLETEWVGESELLALTMTATKLDVGDCRKIVDAVAQCIVNQVQADELARRRNVIESLGKELELRQRSIWLQEELQSRPRVTLVQGAR
jgi:hypothetical protein